MQTEEIIVHESLPIEWVGTFAGSRVCRVTIDGEETQLKIPKGMRGVKVGARLVVRIEYRDWFKMTRTTVSLLDGSRTTAEERCKYSDGQMHAHPTIIGVDK